MFTKSEATKERAKAYSDALEREKEGYQARLKALKDGKHERLDEAQLKARVSAVDEQLKHLGKAPRSAHKATDSSSKSSSGQTGSGKSGE